jgi:RimJ/RimL family protein N-acetyltransferase
MPTRAHAKGPRSESRKRISCSTRQTVAAWPVRVTPAKWPVHARAWTLVGVYNHGISTFAAEALPIRRLSSGELRPVLQVFEGLSERSRRLRFLGPKPRLGESELAQLVDVGCCGREAVVAADPLTGDAVGIARYVRTGADTAEVAFEVTDDWQGRGVGRRLALELAAVAAADGIRRLSASIAVDNPAALAVMKRLGHVEWTAYDGGAYEVVVALPT